MYWHGLRFHHPRVGFAGAGFFVPAAAFD